MLDGTRRDVHPSPESELKRGIGRVMDVANLPLPDVFQLWNPPIENQGNVGNCVAQSIAAIYEGHEKQHFPSLAHRDFSVGFTYGVENWNVGMVPSQACDTTVRLGNVLRKDFESYLENRGCYDEAQRVKGTLSPIRYFGDYVSLGKIDLVKRFIWRYKIPALITIKDNTHAVACIGWKKVIVNSGIVYQNGKPIPFEETEDRLIYVNSYGKSWGDNGIGETAKINEGWGLVPMSGEINFPDVPKEHWAYEAIQEAAKDGIAKGFEDGSFRPDEPITRAQYCVIYKRLRDLGML